MWGKKRIFFFYQLSPFFEDFLKKWRETIAHVGATDPVWA